MTRKQLGCRKGPSVVLKNARAQAAKMVIPPIR